MVIGLVLSSSPGYSETFFRNKIRFLKESGIRVIVFVDNSNSIKAEFDVIEGFHWDGGWLSKGTKTIQAITRLMWSPNKALTLYRLNKNSGFTKKENLISLLVSAHILRYRLDWIHFGFVAASLGRENLASVLETKLAVSLRGYGIAIYPVKNPDCYNLLWKRVDKLHYLSDDLLSLAIKQGFSIETPNQKITPAIDISLFRGNKDPSFGNPLKIVTVARLHWIKGLEYTLEALSLLDKKGIDFEYTLIGEGSDYERLVFASYQLGIKEKVVFLGQKTPHEIGRVLQDSDLYLQYSIHEGFCNAVLEAQAMGLLCIVSDGGGLPENVLHERTGWVVPKRNPEALADQLIKVINLPALERTQISRAAIERVEQNFNLERQKLEFLEFYR